MLIMGKISLPKMSKPTVTLLLLLVALGVAEKIGLRCKSMCFDK